MKSCSSVMYFLWFCFRVYYILTDACENLYIEIKAHFSFFTKLLDLLIAVLCLGTSETQVFDEQSPSGSDYLAEVKICYILAVHLFHSPCR